MTQIHNIRELYFSEGKKISEIARETGHDRKTIREYINKDDWNENKVESINEPEFPKLEAFKSIIDSWLTDDLEAKKKQRHTAKRVYDRLFVLNTRERLIVLIELLPVTLPRKRNKFLVKTKDFYL